jgi:hypothetical protein
MAISAYRLLETGGSVKYDDNRSGLASVLSRMSTFRASALAVKTIYWTGDSPGNALQFRIGSVLLWITLNGCHCLGRNGAVRSVYSEE